MGVIVKPPDPQATETRVSAERCRRFFCRCCLPCLVPRVKVVLSDMRINKGLGRPMRIKLGAT